MAKSKVYSPPTCTYQVSGDHFVTDKSVKNKVTGTSMAGILGISKWSTPFQAACALLGLCREDISSKPAVNAGRILETPLIRYADKKWGKSIGMFLPAEAIFDKRKGEHDEWKSDFEDETFAGHVDGIVMSETGAEYVLEVKTSANLDDWVEGVPEYYYWQVALYNHFIGKRTKAYVLLGMVNEYTYRDPFGFVPSENNVSLFEMDIDVADVNKRLDEIREWYNKYIVNGITPDYDPNNEGDKEMYAHLCSLARDINDVSEELDRLSVVERAIEEWENTKYDLYTEREMLKGDVKAYMLAHKLTTLTTKSGSYYAQIGEQNRTKLDEAAMVADGIDVDKYRIKSTANTFAIKKSK